MNLTELMKRIREVLPDDVDDETWKLVERTASAAVLMAARAAAGEDVDSDLRHVKAQAANLSTEYLGKTADVVRDYLLEVVGKVIVRIL